MTFAIVPVKQSTPTQDPYEIFLAAMLLMYMRAPARKTAPGEPVDLGEIGSAPEGKTFDRWCPYSVARRCDV
jgi:hypothetical protein